MPSRLRCAVVHALTLVAVSSVCHGQSVLASPPSTAVPHPLSWWTKDPLRADSHNTLGLGRPGGSDDRKLTPADFDVKQQVTTLGTVAGHRILQIMTELGGPRRYPGEPVYENPTGWKALLVQDTSSPREWVEIYGLRENAETYVQPLKDAHIYGAGPNAILANSDAINGNGGQCSDGYWWFNETGAHSVDFKPLLDAVKAKTPANGIFWSRCWALDPAKHQIRSAVQKKDARCHACDYLGFVTATYRIAHGKALPVKVYFDNKPFE